METSWQKALTPVPEIESVYHMPPLPPSVCRADLGFALFFSDELVLFKIWACQSSTQLTYNFPPLLGQG